MAEANSTTSIATSSPSVVPDEPTIKPVPTVWDILASMDYFEIETKMILSALVIIYLGAHASLRRPPSAAPPKKLKRKAGKLVVDDEKEHFAQGFQASDAIMFPVLAGVVLIGLYYLIKWLQDPNLLNKILRAYMAISGVFGMGVFFSDCMRSLLSLVFPDYWTDRSGRVFEVDAVSRTQKLVKLPQGDESEKEVDLKKGLPLPGFASELSVSAGFSKAVWMGRHLLREDCILSVVVLNRSVNFEVTVTGLAGLLLACAVEGLYLHTNSTALSNILGLAVCYSGFIWMSVTSFAIGTLVLVGLFVYDIVMVFYTPFMIAVATQIDAPIKLTYEAAGRSSLLGLGDIVIPGIFICLALRFDLWRHYQGKVTRVEENLETVSKEENTNSTDNQVTTIKTAHRTVKAPFVDPRGQWGNQFWTTSLRSFISRQPAALKVLSDASFPKTYFYATMFGYFVGMLATLVVLIVFQRGQPALLYLVPGVVGSAWLTGLLKGELKDMWKYTEDGSLDVEDVVVEVDGEGKVIEKKKDEKKEMKDCEKHGEAEGKKDEVERKKLEDEEYELFRFSIILPNEQSVKED
ncbi:Intramembrane protease 2 [Cytospora mali]|uniref:Intramembrane protease 2 n=1 Tax=Cytospora mali TaxID=578113 RepID=A0A194UWL4_CYTMA|nr:Intramembrane protease 2 [Valsa mali var. pyri (nom. inval.)]